MKRDGLKNEANDSDNLLQSVKPLNTKEASEYLGISPNTLYKYTHKNKIVFYKPNGKNNYFRRSDLDAFILRNRSKSDYEIEQEAINQVMFGRSK